LRRFSKTFSSGVQMSTLRAETTPEIIVSLDQKPNPIRVLHVDDETGFLKMAKQLLEMEGPFQVEGATSVNEALAKLSESEFDVIVSDYVMPGKNGLDFLKELKERGENASFIIFTGQGREEVAKEALNLGADQYLNKSGDPETVYCELAHSITKAVKMKKADETLRQSEKKYRQLVETLQEGIWCIDKDGHTTFTNPRMAEILGYVEGEMIGKHLFSFMDERGISLAKDNMKRRKQGIREQHDFEFIRKDGTRIYTTLEISPLVDENGHYNGAIAGVMDITGRRNAEKMTLESQRKFERLFKNNPEAAVYLSPDFHVWDINPRFTELFAYTIDEIKGKNINDIIVPEGKADEAAKLDEKAEVGYVYHDTVRKRKDGSLVPVSVSAAPIAVEGKLLGHVALYKDISELKSTEAALKQTMQKLVTMNEKLRVVGRLTRHDVRNKLSVVTGNVFLSRKKLADRPEMLGYLNEIELACQQVVDIFDFARNYEMLGDEELKYISLAETFDKAVTLFANMKGAKTVNHCQGIAVLADSLLVRLFYNLIDNSLKYGEKLTQIKIHCESIGQDQLKLIYEDDGAGISLTDKPNIFMEGYGKGTGYGLYLIKKIMEVYGWAIHETGELGRGAQFTIIIPKRNRDGKEGYKTL